LAPTAALRVERVTAGYRGVPVLREVSFEVAEGRVLGLVGPNGAGKSTLLDVVCGALKPQSGHVWLSDRDVTRLPVHRRARLGLGRTFQRLEPFSSLNIADNLLVAAEIAAGRGMRARIARPAGLSRASRAIPPPAEPGSDAAAADDSPAAVVHRLLRRFGLVDFAGQPLSAVPTGVARLVEIARALAAGARVLLLDEPSSGMSEPQVREFAGAVTALRADGLSLVLVEHDPELVDAVCDEVLELNVNHPAAGPPRRAGISRAGGWRPMPSK
jgi:branched-chain amino acid transport system ATP-binding protein